MITLHDIKLPYDSGIEEIKRTCAKKAGLNPSRVKTFRILRRSLDARNPSKIQYVYSVKIGAEEEAEYSYHIDKVTSNYRPIVIGFGPAGMFASLVLARSGLNPIIFERGECVEKRKKTVELFRSSGLLDTESNAQFGAGGAGAFSDGKLNTGIKGGDRIEFVLRTFVSHGADEQILIDAKPHIGTDKLLPMVESFSQEVISLGGSIHYSTKVKDIDFYNDYAIVKTDDGEYKTDKIVLAIGHSARDTYRMLKEKRITMESKAYSMGFRVEHLQEEISKALYRDAYDKLPPADYKLVKHTSYGGVYTFCMCPGGYVTATSSEEGGVVTNGMSYSLRDGVNANSGVLFTINGEADPFANIQNQVDLERKAFELGGGNFNAPCQLLGDFVKGRDSKAFGRIQPTYKPGVKFARLDKALPQNAVNAFKEAFTAFGKSIKGFDCDDALLTGFETRSSSPLRIVRGENLTALGNSILYPCGEGCGYAGGITSAAVDGIKVAEAIIASLK